MIGTIQGGKLNDDLIMDFNRSNLNILNIMKFDLFIYGLK